jgi:hypothetical protein
MYDPTYDYEDSEQAHYDRVAHAAMCDEPEWFDEDRMPVFADAADAQADMEGGY